MGIYKLDLTGKHQQKCRYIPQPCPVNKLNLGNCTWTGISSNMMAHLRQAHRPMCVEYYHHPIRGVTRDTRKCKFILTDKDVFCSRSEIKN